ncbi:MAG: exosome complex RNA-binding protein Csl4 [Candidatus Bathyarchaeia archaeon]|nr:exosome complex RNA-binding protein Csl4 [Candidatus Bathyarchaeota archaeon]
MPRGSDGGEHTPYRLRERFVYPGERLAVEEEFFSGRGTYMDRGVIRSEALGRALYDMREREVRVSKATREPIIPIEGFEVIGEVGSVQRRMANVDVFIVSGREVSRPYTGVIYPPATKRSSRGLDMAVRSGDIIKGKIINTKNRVLQISIDEEEYGVILAYCSRCGSPLEYRRTRLHCPRCGRVDRRKIAKQYGLEALN